MQPAANPIDDAATNARKWNQTGKSVRFEASVTLFHRVLINGPMNSACMIIEDVIAHRASQTGITRNKHMIEELAWPHLSQRLPTFFLWPPLVRILQAMI